MARQVNQNIYGVRLNHSRQLIIGHVRGHAPICHHGLHALGGLINAGFVVVAKHFKLVGVVRGKNRLNEFSNRVVVEIRRHISNAQTARGIRVRFGACFGQQGIDVHPWNKTFKLVTKLFVLFKNLRQIWLALIVQRQHIVAVDHGVFNIQRNGNLKVGNRLCQFTLQRERIGKLVVRNAARVWRQQGKRLARKFNRIIKLTGVGELLGKSAMPMSATIIGNHLSIARNGRRHVPNGLVDHS